MYKINTTMEELYIISLIKFRNIYLLKHNNIY